MEKTSEQYRKYLNILKEELRPAMGCTEPVSLAYAAALARDALGVIPEKVFLKVSGNIIKNVKSVVIPNTDGLHGISAAVAAGIIAGRAEKCLETLGKVSEKQKKDIRAFLENAEILLSPATDGLAFDIDITVCKGENQARVRIVNNHTNIVHISKNGVVESDMPFTDHSEDSLTDKSCLNIDDIVAFADIVDIDELKETVGKQIEYNMAIAEEGIQNNWGANIGKVILRRQGTGVEKRACAYAAAGSDARMSGCEKPVYIISGSGNQGITASVPVAVYAKEIGTDEETLLRAVAVSDLVTIHQKAGIGRLSAFCGAISAGCGAGAGVAYLCGGKAHAVAHTVVNAIAILSGTICDGAKPSCAAKIAAAVDAGLLGYDMYMEHQQFYGGDGIVTKGADKTVINVGRLAREGMKDTDTTILKIMLGE